MVTLHRTNVSEDSLAQQDIADVEMMLYICKNCDKSISVPLLKEENEKSFLFPVSTGGYLYLSFEKEDAQLYDYFQNKLALYLYPYVTFHGFERETFLKYVNNRIYADLIDHQPNESVGPSTRIHCCPYCGAQKLKPIGKLITHSLDESQVSIRYATLDHWNSLSEEEKNKKIILLLKKYASEYSDENPKRYTLLRKKEEKQERKR